MATTGFNPRGILYTDKLWGTSRDVLCQELSMPPGHVVPVHAHAVRQVELAGSGTGLTP